MIESIYSFGLSLVGTNRVGPSGLQIMRLGWNIFIPVTLVWLVVVGAWKQTSWNI